MWQWKPSQTNVARMFSFRLGAETPEEEKANTGFDFSGPR